MESPSHPPYRSQSRAFGTIAVLGLGMLGLSLYNINNTATAYSQLEQISAATYYPSPSTNRFVSAKSYRVSFANPAIPIKSEKRHAYLPQVIAQQIDSQKQEYESQRKSWVLGGLASVFIVGFGLSGLLSIKTSELEHNLKLKNQ